jgi:hypothetical protein
MPVDSDEVEEIQSRDLGLEIGRMRKASVEVVRGGRLLQYYECP